MRKDFEELFKQIEYGDKEHRQWLWDKMEEFSKSYQPSVWGGSGPEGAALSTLIHDTNSALGQIHYYTSKLDEWLRENAEFMKAASIKSTNVYIISEYIKSSKAKIQSTIDNYYTKYKKNFNE